jgi:hypothetical protein
MFFGGELIEQTYLFFIDKQNFEAENFFENF